MSKHYISKAEKIVLKEEVSPDEIDKIYEYLSTALDYKKDLPKSIEISEKISQASIKCGYQKAYDLQINFIRKYLKLNPYSWDVQINLISSYSLRGDLKDLDLLINEFENMESNEANEKNKFSFLVLKAIAYANILPWIESQGYLSTNINPEHTIEYLKEYKSYLDKAYKVKEKIEDKNNLTLKQSIDKQLQDAYEVAVYEAFKNEKEIKRNIWIYEKINSDPKFSKALNYTFEGNKYLIKKDYRNARILYQAAINNYENFVNARKQMIETDFQQAMSLALVNNKTENLKDTFYTCYEDIKELIENSPSDFSLIPFISNDKFLSDLYALKAAIISGLLTIEDFPPKRKLKIKAEFEFSLNKAIELNPNNKLARDMFERQRNEGK